jgi:hypothetical protein
MKNIILLFIISTTLFSCSSSDENAPEVIQKVVFYSNSANERQWHIDNGLLTNITLADGTVVEEFVYDNLNRVVQDIKYTNGAVTETNSITYNDNSIITAINGLPYTFNAASHTYAYSYGSNFTINCQVNSDQLAINFVRTGTNPGVYHMTYDNGNMTSFEKTSSGIESLKNFHFDAGFGSNPIYDAILAVAKVKSLTDPNFFIDCQVSKNMANGFDGGSSVPYYFNYGIVPDTKLRQIGIEVLDSNNNPIDFYSFADYYYR